MAEEQKLIITLEVNAKGEATLKNLKRDVEELNQQNEKGSRANKRTKEEEKSLTDERDRGSRVVQRKRKSEADHSGEVDRGGRAAQRAKKEETERTTATETGRRAVERKRRAEREHTDEVDRGRKATEQSRDAQGRFVAGAGRAQRAIVELANSQGQLTNAIALGVVKAQLFIGLIQTGFRLGLNLVTAPIRALSSGLSDVIENVVTATEKFDRFRITLEGALKSAERAREVSAFVQEYALKSPVKVEDVQELTKSIALIPGLRSQFFGDITDVKDRLSDLYDTVIGLSSLNPQQGIPGAVFAIREALTGQFRSLRARFDIMPEIVAGSIGKTVGEIKKSPKLVIAALKEFVAQSVGGDTLRELGRLPSVRIANIVEGLTSIAPRQIGSAGFQSFISDVVGQIDDSLQGFFSSGGAFETKFAPRISTRLQGIVLQGLRLIGTALGGADEALGGVGAPSLERFADTFDRVLARVEESIKGFADRFGQNRESVVSFFATIIDTIKRAFDAFVDVVNNLPKALPAIAGFLSALVALTGTVLKLFTSIPAFLGSAGQNAIFNTLAPDVAENLRTTGNVSKFGTLVQGQSEGRNLTEEFGHATDALTDLALEGRDTFRTLDEGYKNDRRSSFRALFRGEIGAGGERQGAIQQLLAQLGDRGTGANRGAQLEARLRAEAESAQAVVDIQGKLVSAGVQLTEAEQNLASRLKARTELEKDRERAAGGVTSRLNLETFEVEKTTTIAPELRGLGLADRTERTPVAGEAGRRLLQQIGGRVPGEFGGAISGIKDLGLQVQERLNKLLLDPLQEADAEFLKAQESHASAVENLEKAVRGATEESAERVRNAIEGVDRDIAAGVLTGEQSAELKSRIVKTAEDVASAIAKAARANAVDSDRFLAIANAAGLQNALQVLTKTDLTAVRELDRAFEGVNKRIAVMQPLLTETAAAAFSELQTRSKPVLEGMVRDLTEGQRALLGFDPEPLLRGVEGAKSDFEGLGAVLRAVNAILADPTGIAGAETLKTLKGLADQAVEFTTTIGPEQIKGLASFAFGSRQQGFQQTQAVRGAFGGGTPEAELQTLEDQLRAVTTRGEVEERIRRIVNDRAVTDRERATFEERVTELTAREADQLKIQVGVKRLSLGLAKDEERLQRTLADISDPGDRYDVIAAAVATVDQQIGHLREILASADGQAVANLLGIGDPAKARAAAEGAIAALEARRKQLGDVLRDSDPNKRARDLIKNVRPGETVSAQSVFGALPERQKRAIEDEYGKLGTRVGLAFLDHFELVTAENGKLRLKTLEEIFEDGFVKLALKAADALQTAIGDTIYDIFTGNLKDISQVWDNFLKSLLRAFADFIAELIVKAAIVQAIKAFGSGFAEGGVTGNIQGVRRFAYGGIAGPGAGGPIVAMIGEGGRREGIVPLTANDSIPARFDHGQFEALLPGGRTIPIQTGYAMGGVTAGPVSPVSVSSAPPPTVIVVNVLDPAEVVSMGLPSNGLIIENQVAGSLRNRGAVGKALKRFGR